MEGLIVEMDMFHWLKWWMDPGNGSQAYEPKEISGFCVIVVILHEDLWSGEFAPQSPAILYFQFQQQRWFEFGHQTFVQTCTDVRVSHYLNGDVRQTDRQHIDLSWRQCRRTVPLTTSMEELQMAGKACSGVLMPRSVPHGGWAACLLRGNSCPALTGTAKWHCSTEPLQISAHRRHHDLDFLLTNISKI